MYFCIEDSWRSWWRCSNDIFCWLTINTQKMLSFWVTCVICVSSGITSLLLNFCYKIITFIIIFYCCVLGLGDPQWKTIIRQHLDEWWFTISLIVLEPKTSILWFVYCTIIYCAVALGCISLNILLDLSYITAWMIGWELSACPNLATQLPPLELNCINQVPCCYTIYSIIVFIFINIVVMNEGCWHVPLYVL